MNTDIAGFVGLAALLVTSVAWLRADTHRYMDRLESRLNGRMDERMDRFEAHMDRLESGQDGLRERMARLEGMVDGLCEAVAAAVCRDAA